MVRNTTGLDEIEILIKPIKDFDDVTWLGVSRPTRIYIPSLA